MKSKIIVFIFAASMVALTMFPTLATSSTVYVEDTVVNWNGYNNYKRDEIGNPKLTGLTVNSGSKINSITLHTDKHSEFKYFSNLFIDTLGNGSWNYIIKNDGKKTSIYKVAKDYEYTFATTGRKGHPNGISDKYLEFMAYMDTTVTGNYGKGYNETYDFAGMGMFANGFSIGYTPYCSNDVLYASFGRWTDGWMDNGGGWSGNGNGNGSGGETPQTPEPATILLFGVGLIIITSVLRRKKNVHN